MNTTNHGFVKIATANPIITVANPQANIEKIETIAVEADKNGATIILFPELSITGCTCADLFQSQLLQQQAINALESLAENTKELAITMIVGLPMAVDNILYNCATVIHRGEILAIVPKTYIATNEQRWFRSGRHTTRNAIKLSEQTVPFGNDIILKTNEFNFAIEIGHDLLAPIPQSALYATKNVHIVFNPSAISYTVGSKDYIEQQIEQYTARTNTAYVYTSAGFGESTTNASFISMSIMYENGDLIAQENNFECSSMITYSNIDIELLNNRRQINTLYQNIDFQPQTKINTIYTDIAIRETAIKRVFDKNPFTQDDNINITLYGQISHIQTTGLATRLHHIHVNKMVIGVSGGLDSTLALLICARAADTLDIPRRNIIGVTMPGFGTTNRTYTNATQLITKLGATLLEIPIKDACLQHFKDIDHNPEQRDTTYENSQARERTQILMDLANKHNALVIGTGDMSELALGWATYNGDQMSMYSLNAGVPKTVIAPLLSYLSNFYFRNENIDQYIEDVVNTPVSPELLPAEADDSIAQKTEDLVGPYELHDFFMYHTLYSKFTPEKIQFIANMAFEGKYDEASIKHWLTTFLRRFFMQQFKRNPMPDGPSVFEISLNPQNSWQMPSDASSQIWLEDIK